MLVILQERKPQVSVVVPTHNRAGSLRECLEALSSQTCPCLEVIVVDDGSTDGTADVAESYRGRGVRCVRQGNLGASAARNRGAREARGDVVCFTDDDCVPCKDWLERITGAFSEEGVSVIGGRVVYSTGLGPKTLLERFMEKWDVYNGRGEVYLTGINSAYRRGVFMELGGFDEGMRALEDSDLHIRFVGSGRKPVYAPEAVVCHRTRDSVPALMAQFFAYGRGWHMLHRKYPKRYGAARLVLPRLGSIALNAARTPYRLLLCPLSGDIALYALEPALKALMQASELAGIACESVKPHSGGRDGAEAGAAS